MVFVIENIKMQFIEEDKLIVKIYYDLTELCSEVQNISYSPIILNIYAIKVNQWAASRVPFLVSLPIKWNLCPKVWLV